ncbi:MAG: aminotransferase class I/II-fold pyridoxal phosphate-dependent enzyme [Candidatus Dojkabacteria bacterium]|nr:aminotransferase class I/II-fold pyridoxal phosphate-dependent enzyme [Candidatus Dojkabacteria bacterium]
MAKTIFTSLSPNTQEDDYKLARKLLFKSNQFEDGADIEELRKWFSEKMKVDHVTLYESARTGLFFLLKELGIGGGDEVIVQAFTCVASVNPIKWTGAKPRYVDIDTGTFNIDINDLQNKINSKTKAILVQHTFGYPAEIDKILEFAKSNDLYVIEDCAHTIGGEYQGKILGSFGDGAIFSLGRDKGISASFGGVVVVKRKLLGQKLIGQERFLSFPAKSWVRRQLAYTVTSYLTRKYYNSFVIGKLIHQSSFGLKFVNRSTELVEKVKGSFPTHAKCRIPSALARVALNQLQKLDKLNSVRVEFSKYYQHNLRRIPGTRLPKWHLYKRIYPLRFPLLVERRDEFVKFMDSNGVLVGDWYDVPVAPKEVNLLSASYQLGSCPNAEAACQRVVNLPLNVNMSENGVKRVAELTRVFFEERR